MRKITIYHTLVSLLVLVALLFLANYLFLVSLVKGSKGLVAVLLLFLLSAGLVVSSIYLLFRYFRLSLPQIIKFTNKIAQGQADTDTLIKTDKTLLPLLAPLTQLAENTKNATNFAIAIGQGDLDTIAKATSQDDVLSNSLRLVQEKLKKIAIEEEEGKLYAKGRYDIGELLRHAQRNGNLQELYDTFLKGMINYLFANQGAIYLVNEEKAEDVFIELIAVYAYSKKKYIEKRIGLKEGLIGQCIVEKNSIYLEEIPNTYLHITSGLGAALPKALLIVPIKIDEKVLGAIEIASFKPFSANQVRLAETLAERLAGTIATIQANLQTKKLLDTSNRINKKLIQREEQMRANSEELSKTKEELSKKLLELEKETNLSIYILEAINKTNAAVGFDINGNILEVNDMYLRVMGYKKEELIGTNEKVLLPNDEIDSEKYKILWDSLRSGAYITGEYRRISKQGREVWLNGTYNPIFDVNGSITKVIQFSQFTTEEKEKDLDYASKISALNQSMPVLELDLEGNIKTANQIVANITGFKRSQLINKKLVKFIHPMLEFTAKWENLHKGQAQSIIIAFIGQDEKLIFFLANFSPIKNLSGKIYKVQAIMTDLTEQKEMEIELLNRQEKMSEMVHNLELARFELQNREKELEKLLAQERAKNVILSSQDAAEEALFAEKLTQILDFVSRQDVSNLNSLIEKAAMPALAVNTNGNIIIANQEMQDFLSYTQQEINTLNINYLINEEIEKQQELILKILKGDVVKHSILLKNKVGNYLPSRLISMPIFSGEADILVFLLPYSQS